MRSFADHEIGHDNHLLVMVSCAYLVSQPITRRSLLNWHLQVVWCSTLFVLPHFAVIQLHSRSLVTPDISFDFVCDDQGVYVLCTVITLPTLI